MTVVNPKKTAHRLQLYNRSVARLISHEPGRTAEGKKQSDWADYISGLEMCLGLFSSLRTGPRPPRKAAIDLAGFDGPSMDCV